jgi:hypothetical protein
MLLFTLLLRLVQRVNEQSSSVVAGGMYVTLRCRVSPGSSDMKPEFGAKIRFLGRVRQPILWG